MDLILRASFGLILFALLIVVYMLWLKTGEGFESPGEALEIEALMASNLESYSDFKQMYPKGDAIIYSDLLKANLTGDLNRDKVKKIYNNWK